MKEVTFVAQVGGDGECFRWEGVSSGISYPDQIMDALGVNREKRYRFTIKVEEM